MSDADLTETTAEEPDASPRGAAGFGRLGLARPILAALEAVGYTEPTDIQAAAIPPLLSGRDVIGLARTGTGKTAAFALPMLQRVDTDLAEVQGLVIAPTRELAEQVSASIRNYGSHLDDLHVLAAFGGAPIGRQLSRLDRGVHVVVGTPGRLMDLMRRGALSLASLATLVLDEADEMLRMGFIDDIEWIVSEAPDTRQTVLFSATMPPPIKRVAKRYLSDPETIAVQGEVKTVATTDQRHVVVPPFAKLEALTRVLDVIDSEAVLVFARTRAGCAELAEALEERGFAPAALHGDMSQAQRQDVLRRLRKGHARLVIATDVAARGLDVDDITHVINFDVPGDAETYVHRIGRTGRAGREGMAILFVTPRERRRLRAIEDYTGQRIRPVGVPTLEAIAERRRERFFAAVASQLDPDGADALAPYRGLAATLIETHQGDVEAVTAAIIALAARGRSLFAEGEEPRWMIGGPPERRDRDDRPPRRDRDDRPPRRDRDDRPRPPREPESGMVRMFVSLGRRAGLSPADIVGTVANGCDLPGSVVGRIEIRDKIAFFDLNEGAVDRVLGSVGQFHIRGRRGVIRRARPEGDRFDGDDRADRRPHFAPGRPPERRRGGPKKHYRGRS